MNYLTNLNDSKLFSGITMLLLNLGSKYLVHELSETQEDLLSNKIIRRIVLFCVVFMATKDIKISIMITGAFIIFVTGLFNEDSKFCIIRKEYFTQKNKISKKEYLKSKKIVDKYEKQKK